MFSVASPLNGCSLKCASRRPPCAPFMFKGCGGVAGGVKGGIKGGGGVGYRTVESDDARMSYWWSESVENESSDGSESDASGAFGFIRWYNGTLLLTTYGSRHVRQGVPFKIALCTERVTARLHIQTCDIYYIIPPKIA